MRWNYVLFAVFGGALIALVGALPGELIKTVAGLGLMGCPRQRPGHRDGG